MVKHIQNSFSNSLNDQKMHDKCRTLQDKETRLVIVSVSCLYANLNVRIDQQRNRKANIIRSPVEQPAVTFQESRSSLLTERSSLTVSGHHINSIQSHSFVHMEHKRKPLIFVFLRSFSTIIKRLKCGVCSVNCLVQF